MFTTPANNPNLPSGMIPVKYDATCNSNAGCWLKADESNINNDWYNYDAKIWANAVMVKTDATSGIDGSKSRTTYMSDNVGTEILENDILAYFVWIPRYRYKLFNTAFDKAIYSSDSICTANCPQTIEIEFESINDPISDGTCNQIYTIPTDNCYYSHPAFWWDNDSDGNREVGEELEGIWTGKFVTTHSQYLSIKPNTVVLTNQNVATQFNTAKKFKSGTYLVSTELNNIDTHMAKNMEWGAITYLSQSRYGKNGSIEMSNNSSLSGAGNYSVNLGQSTTGNIYGVYDMSKKSGYEYVMGVSEDHTGTNTPMSGCNDSDLYPSGFSGYVYYDHNGIHQRNFTYVSGKAFPPKKYYDLYKTGQYKLGDATKETRGWFAYSSRVPAINVPWVARGIMNQFYFLGSCGSEANTIGFRTILIKLNN